MVALVSCLSAFVTSADFDNANGVTLREPYVLVALSADAAKATATVSVKAVNRGKTRIAGVLRGLICPENSSSPAYRFYRNIEFAPGAEESLKFEPVEMNKPDLWWPNGVGYGKGRRPLYRMELEFWSEGVVCDSVSKVFGVRTFATEMPEGGKEGEFLFIVNGRKVLPRGADWTSGDTAPLRSDEDFIMAVRRYAAIGFNMIRVPRGISDADAFYDACDRNGIMVFEDFRSSATTPASLEYVREKVMRVRQHPCLAVWCNSHNGKAEPGEDEGVRAILDELDPEKRRYQTVVGPGGFASGVLPPPKPERYGYSGDDTARLRYFNQLADFEICRWSFETLNERMYSRAPGDNIRALAGDAAGGILPRRVFDGRNELSAGFFGCMSACRDVHIQMNPVDFAIKTINHGSDPIEHAELTVQVFNPDGEIKFSYNGEFTAAANANTLNQVPFAPKSIPALADVFYVSLMLRGPTGALLDRNFYWFSKGGNPLDCSAMAKLPSADVQVSLTRPRLENGVRSYTLVLENRSGVPAIGMWLGIVDASGERIKATWADNCVSMGPSERRKVNVRFRDSDMSGKPGIAIEGCNVPSRIVR